MSRMLCALLLGGLLGACSVLPESEPLDLYRLPASALPSQAHAGVRSDWALRVNTPAASALLDSTRIAVLPQGDRLSAYQGARWVDRASLLLRDRLLDGFRDDGRLAALSSDSSGLRADLLLDSDLRSFQGDYHGQRPEAHIRLEARLVQGGSRRILASRRFEVRQAASGRSVAAMVSALGAAADRLTAQLVQWALEQGQATRARD
ncbi:membrane integrity-associated transporter subunit PqiC [Pseudomonas sp. LPB0260]|uniref:ABC-type transport auxiliary lipoprotein family protein n=1 Tax=Pseudomonas sp. LPB0260 TaxID=2614442 RepID=UPI0015C22C4D|nr:ABC-type transport auxiliary lipoprotein family protein [Pseudomonas sp. LPB0260]QLC73378.1 membrane integrity-associated transporter subunit PqiC [Pseudomonas sp. LPB0260]QLC76152.1 membrane integrity-associated transporter subunit PqiC [Pseudomonas sp. LPB0260]